MDDVVHLRISYKQLQYIWQKWDFFFSSQKS